jgi:hypothetical protein
MPRLFTVRNAVVAVNILLFTALFLHLKKELWDPAVGLAELSHLPDELLDDQTTTTSHGKDTQLHINAGPKMTRKTAIVVASQASENATWLQEYFPHWQANIYRVDDPNAPLTVPKNKGRESMVYLTCVAPPRLNSGGLQANVWCAVTSSIIMIPLPTTCYSSTRTDISGTTTTLTTMAFLCSGISSSHTLRRKGMSISVARGLLDVQTRSNR